MDLIVFGTVALLVAIAGLLASVVIGSVDAYTRREERRYLERTARYALSASRRTARP